MLQPRFSSPVYDKGDPQMMYNPTVFAALQSARALAHESRACRLELHHVLLALVKLPKSCLRNMLEQLDIDHRNLRLELEKWKDKVQERAENPVPMQDLVPSKELLDAFDWACSESGGGELNTGSVFAGMVRVLHGQQDSVSVVVECNHERLATALANAGVDGEPPTDREKAMGQAERFARLAAIAETGGVLGENMTPEERLMGVQRYTAMASMYAQLVVAYTTGDMFRLWDEE